MKLKCPTCKKITELEDSQFRPFCSEKCKLIDLGAWAEGEYRIEGKLDSESEDWPSGKEIGHA